MNESAEPEAVTSGRRAGDRVESPAPAHAAPVPSVYRLRLRDLWRFFTKQPVSYWLVCTYLFFEYVRPQEIYEPLRGLPVPFWAIVLCGVTMLLEGIRPRRWTVIDTGLVVFSSVVALSAIFAYSPSHAFEGMRLYLSWVLIYILITSIVDNDRRFFVFMALFLLFCAKMAQHGARGWAASGFGFRSWGVTCAPSWFRNSGECGIQMSIVFVISTFFAIALGALWGTLKRALIWCLPVASVITMIASSSRGAIIALGGLAFWLVAMSRHKLRAFAAMAVLAGAVYAVLPAQQIERFQAIGEDESSTRRIGYWKDGIGIVRNHPILGIGHENWLPYYQRYYDPTGELPHNIFVEAATELGYTGLAAFLFLIAGTFIVNRQTRKLASRLPTAQNRFLTAMAFAFDGALVAFIMGGLFVTILYYPYFWINLAMTTALHTSTRRAVQRTRSLRVHTGGATATAPTAPDTAARRPVSVRYGT